MIFPSRQASLLSAVVIAAVALAGGLPSKSIGVATTTPTARTAGHMLGDDSTGLSANTQICVISDDLHLKARQGQPGWVHRSKTTVHCLDHIEAWLGFGSPFGEILHP